MADDDRLVLSTLCLGLMRAGYNVEAVNNGKAAIQAIEKNPPDLVVLDHNMPGATGIEVAQHIRSSTNIPILMLTAYDNIELIEEAAANGINGYFVKPIDSSQLIPSIELNLRQTAARSRFALNEKIKSRVTETGCELFEEQVNQQQLRTINKALSTDQIDLLYQPILDARTGQVNHFEALLRLVQDDGSYIAPAEFLDSAERSGLIRALDYRVLQMAVTRLAAIEASGGKFSISVNLSGVHFGNPELLNHIREFLREEAVSPERLIFEVTETAAMQDLEQARQFILELKELGCRFALDDFGTGYASFYYLRSLPVDYIKIDGVFVRELQNTEQDRLFIKAMVDVSQGLGIKTIAEYVSNQETLDILKSCGVDYMQGYYIGKPGLLPDLNLSENHGKKLKK